MPGTALMLIVTLAATHLAACWGAWAWVGRPDRTLTLGRVVLGVVAMACLSVLEMLALKGRGLDRGAIMQLAWIDLVVVTPLAGLGLLLARPRGWQLTPWARRAALLSLATLPLGAYAWCIEPYALRVERADVLLAPERAGSAPVTLGVLADLQMASVGDHERRAVDELMALRPDVILVPGDIFEGPAAEFAAVLPEIQALLGRLSAPGGVWIVTGDVDIDDDFARITEGTSATILWDDVVELTVADRRITLLGLDRRGWADPALAALEQRAGDDDVRIVLAHRPRTLLKLSPDTRVDLLVAGHTHGGQVALPFLGPLYVGSPLPTEVAAGGLHVLDGRRLYISRGVGMERHTSPRIRFLAPPEISLLTLR